MSVPDRNPFYCDVCRKSLGWGEEGVWYCTVCYEVNFCNVCIAKLRNGTLPHYVCSPYHKYVHLPWIEEYLDTPEGHVRVGGHLEDGKRIGGDFMEINIWLDGIRDVRGLKRAEKDDEAKDDPGNVTEGEVNGEVKNNLNEDKIGQ